MKAMIIKEIRELARDRRTVMLLVAIPLILLIIYGYAANFSIDKTDILIAGPGAKHTEQILRTNESAKESFAITSVEPDIPKEQIEDLLRDRTYNAVIFASEPEVPDKLGHEEPLSKHNHLYIDGSQLFAAQSAQQAWIRTIIEDNKNKFSEAHANIEKFLREIQRPQSNPSQSPMNPNQIREIPILPETSTALDIKEFSTVLFNPELKTSWVMIPGLIGLILTFIGTVITSIGLVRERESGTLEQLAVMPIRPWAIILGKIIPYFALALFDTVLITSVAVWLFGVPFEGSIWRFSIVAALFLFVVLGLGVFVSSISENTGQAIQVAFMLVMPQVLLSGFIFPIESMDVKIQWISYILPLTWFNNAAQGIMLRDTSLTQILSSVEILALMAVVIFGASVIRMHAILRNGGSVR